MAEAEKDGKFYLIYDFRDVFIHVTGLSRLNGSPGGRTIPLIVQEFESKEERAQARDDALAAIASKRVQTLNVASRHVSKRLRKSKGTDEEGGNPPVAARVRPRQPSGSGRGVKPLFEAE